MKVTCNLCEFEVGGACTKKKQAGKPKKIQITKRRHCKVFQEDPMKVFTNFRRKESNRKKLRQTQIRQSKLSAAIQSLQERRDSADV